MTGKNIYLLLAVIGFVAPYYFFLQVQPESWADLPALIRPLFANNFMRGLTADLTVALVTFWVFVLVEANRLRMKYVWVYLLAPILVGLSFALPLFLYVREGAREAR